MKKTIGISFAPNVQDEDLLISFKMLIGLISENDVDEVTEIFRNQFSKLQESGQVFLFSSGRAALYYALKSLNLKKGDEVATQAFTCVAVPNSIVWAGLKPLFIDIDKSTYNIDINDLETKISSKTKAIIIQNTFGIPGPIEKIVVLAKKHGIKIIQDCAHCLAPNNGLRADSRSYDVAVYSFGRDKIISSVFGGAVVTKNNDTAKKITEYEKKLVPAPWWFVKKQLLYAPVYRLSMPFYSFGVGKLLLKTTSYLRLLSKAVEKGEKRGMVASFLNYRFSPYLALLAFTQLKKLKELSDHRKKISRIYIKNLDLPLRPGFYLRVPVQIKKKRNGLIDQAKKAGIYLGDWYNKPISPQGVDYETLDFNPDSCPNAKIVSEKIINLPTHININEDDAYYIVDFMKKHAQINR